MVKSHCGILAVGALRRAIRNYFRDQPRPAWIPESPTPDERHAVEEEKLLEVLAKRAKRMEAELAQDTQGEKTG
jgi:nitrogen fixation NifU-like protein